MSEQMRDWADKPLSRDEKLSEKIFAAIGICILLATVCFWY